MKTSSELILNNDGSIYHLGLKPEHLAPTILTVGDPERVKTVSQHFDSIVFKQKRREFIYHLGTFNSSPIAVISTGIGTDNIDIVFNELDALANIDFSTLKQHKSLKSLKIIRLGTSGSIRKELPVDSILISEAAVGLERIMDWYLYNTPSEYQQIQSALKNVLGFSPCIINSSDFWNSKIPSHWKKGITLTANGFYAPQFRSIRLKSKYTSFIKDLSKIDALKSITNMEMETAGIYGLSNLLGHKAISINAILANRSLNTFSPNPEKTINLLIKEVFEKLL